MRRDQLTLDGRTTFRCLLVGLDDASARACVRALSPLEAIRMRDAREACAKLSEILPLIVVVADDADPKEMPELVELAEACGAEVLPIVRPIDGPALGRRILEALQKAEARRVAR